MDARRPPPRASLLATFFRGAPVASDLVESLQATGFLPAAQAAKIRDVIEGRPMSLHVEIRTMLAVGSTLIVFGVGVLIDRAGVDWKSLGALLVGLAGFACLAASWSRGGGQFTRGAHAQHPILTHVLLNLGVLLLAALAGLLRVNHGFPDTVFLAAGAVFAFLAVYWDSQIVLAHAVLLLGTFLGIEAVPMTLDLLSISIFRTVGAAYAAFLVLTALGLKRWKLKPHFSGVLIDLAIPIALVAGLTGLVRDWAAPHLTTIFLGFGYSILVAAVTYAVGQHHAVLRFKYYALISLEIAALIWMGRIHQHYQADFRTYLLFVVVSCVVLMVTAVRITRAARRTLPRRSPAPAAVAVAEPSSSRPPPLLAAATPPVPPPVPSHAPLERDIRRHDAAVFAHEIASTWKKARLISAAQAARLVERAGPAPHTTHAGLRRLLQVAGAVAAWALLFVIKPNDAPVWPLSAVWAVAALVLGLLLGRLGRFRRGLDDAAWLVFISAAIATVGSLTDAEPGSSHFVLLTGILAALIPAWLYADLVATVILWTLLAAESVNALDNAWAIAGVFLLVALVTGYWRRAARWHVRSRQLLLLQALSLLALYLSFVAHQLPVLFNRAAPDWLAGVRGLHSFALLLLAVAIPATYLHLGLRHRLRLLLDLGILTTVLSLLLLPVVHDLYSDATSCLVGGVALLGTGWLLWLKLSSPPHPTRTFVNRPPTGAVDDGWLPENLENSADQVPDWVGGLRQ